MYEISVVGTVYRRAYLNLQYMGAAFTVVHYTQRKT
jgi:hypothetical protein